MKPDEYEKMCRAETRFWWFAGKGRLVADWSARWLLPGGRHLDVGCGTGANLERAASAGTWIGLDASTDALRFCVERGHRRLVRGRANDLPFADNTFDGAMALDLFEHLDQDGQAAAEILRVLKPGGRLLVTAPAHPFLWGAHDRALGHLRRYRGRSLRALLEGAGFKVKRLTHFMGFLFPAMFLAKLLQKGFGNPSDTMSYEWPEWINRALVAIIAAEVCWLKRLGMPAGTTLAAVAEKPR